MGFKEASELFKKYAEKRHKKQGFYNLWKEFNNKVYPYFCDFDITDITKKDILNWQNDILNSNYSNSYNARIYYVFNSFFTFCCSYLDVPENVVSAVGSFPNKIEEKKTDFYTLKEFNQFIKCFDDDVYKQYFNFLFFTGVRPGEAMALKFSDLNNGYITISKNLRRHGDRGIDTPKNSSSIRTIQIDKKLNNDLLKLQSFYRKKFNEERDYFIFGGLNPLAPTSIDRYKKKACEKAHLRPITQHQFRHSHATLLLQENIVINEVSRRLGHSQVSTTLNIYTHTNSEQEKRVCKTLSHLRHNLFYTLWKEFNKFVYILKR